MGMVGEVSDQLLSSDPNAGQSSAPPAPSVADVPRDTRGFPAVTSGTTDAMPLGDLLKMLGPMAHPATLSDFAGLLTLPVDEARKVAASAMALAKARPAAGAAISATGRGMESLGKGLDKPLTIAGSVGFFNAPLRSVATLVSPSLLRGAGRIAQRLGDVIAGGGAEAEAPIAAASAAPVEAGPVAPAPPVSSPALPSGPASSSGLPPSVPPASPVSTVATGAKLQLKAPEMAEFGRLLKQGKSMKEALDLIEAQRAFAQRLGLPSSAAVRDAVVDRNATGRWPE